MADLLDPTIKDEEKSFDPSKNYAKEDYQQKFNKNLTDNSVGDGEFHYSPDKDRSDLAMKEKSGPGGGTDSTEKSLLNGVSGLGFSYKKTGAKPKRSSIRGFMTKRMTFGLVGGGGGLAVFIVLISFFSSTATLVHVKDNAERTRGGIMSFLNEKRKTGLLRRNRAASRTLFRNLKLATNLDQVNARLSTRGYSFDADGSLRTPSGTLLTEASDIHNEIKRVAKTDVRGYRNRNRVAKKLRRSASLPTRASVDKANLDSDETPEESVKKASRRSVIEGDGTDPEMEQIDDALEDVRNGVDGADEAQEEADDLIENGAEDAPLNERGLARTLASSTDELLEGAGQITENIAERSMGGAAVDFAKGGVNQIIDTSCSVGQAARAAYIAGLIQKKYNLLKIFALFTNNADAIITGRVDSGLLNDFMKVVQNDRNGQSWTASGGMQSIFGSREPGSTRVSPRTFNYFRTDRQDTNSFIRGLISVADAKVTVAGVEQNLCQAAQNPLTQFTVAIGEWGLTAVSGGTTGAATQATARGIGIAVGKAVGVAIATEVATVLGQKWMESYVSTLFTSTLMTFSSGEGGPFAGDAYAASAGVFYETQGRGNGGRPLTSIAYNNLVNEFEQVEKTRLAQRSLFDRFLNLNPKKPDSLLANVILRSPDVSANPVQTARNITTSVAQMKPMSQTSDFFASRISEDAFAQEVQTDANGFVIDPFGNYIVGNDLDAIDPVANFNFLLGDGQITEEGDVVDDSDLADYIDKCTQLDIHEEDTTNNVVDECASGELKYRRFQAYLADYNAAAEYESEFEPQVTTTSSPSVPTGPVDPGQDTSSMQCPAGMEDGGVHQDRGPNGEPTARIRICGIAGAIPKEKGVNASVAANVLAMIEAMRNAGLDPTGSAFRSYETQQSLRQSNCPNPISSPPGSCSPPTAKAGSSQHEVGLAIDFGNMCFARGRVPTCPGNDRWEWLVVNASNYGFKQLESEAWHWSPSGS